MMMIFKLIFMVIVGFGGAAIAGGNGNGDENLIKSTSKYYSSTAAAGTSAPDMLSTYLASFSFEEQQNLLTTILQQQQQNAITDGLDKQTTAAITLSPTTHASTESVQNGQLQNNSETPVAISIPAGQESSTIATATSDTINEPHVDPTTDEHVLLGCGPNNREGIGIQKALDWLREKRMPDYGWENDTHMVILAKELSNGRDPNDSDGHMQMITDLENMLSIKQMEIEIMTMLDKHHPLPKPQDNDRLAKYILSLGSLCQDPRRFYGHDLVAALQHHEPSQDDEFALATLAACSSAAHVRKKQIRRLLDIASGEVTNVDTMAMVLLALRCIITDHRHRHLQHFIHGTAKSLALLQGPRGSFGSLLSTALAMQALEDLEPERWNRTAASKWILDRQRSDGGWTEEPLQDGQDASIGIGLTADIILALGCKGLGAVRALQCDHVMRETNGNGENGENGDYKLSQLVGFTPTSEETEQKNVSYTYTLWLESNITEIFTMTLNSTKNTSFFKAMTQAADQDSRFSFEAREWPNGHYIHTLAGKKEEPALYHYWLLYRLPELPDPYNPPGNQLIASVGVDELLVEEGEHYLYWYKKL
ncbi:unnamed protein product [Diamesa serratosioi]